MLRKLAYERLFPCTSLHPQPRSQSYDFFSLQSLRYPFSPRLPPLRLSAEPPSKTQFGFLYPPKSPPGGKVLHERSPREVIDMDQRSILSFVFCRGLALVNRQFLFSWTPNFPSRLSRSLPKLHRSDRTSSLLMKSDSFFVRCRFYLACHCAVASEGFAPFPLLKTAIVLFYTSALRPAREICC